MQRLAEDIEGLAKGDSAIPHDIRIYFRLSFTFANMHMIVLLTTLSLSLERVLFGASGPRNTLPKHHKPRAF
jgi:hypothetical protein